MKILYYHQGGYCLWAKTFERGIFAKLNSVNNKIALNRMFRGSISENLFLKGVRNISFTIWSSGITPILQKL
ncbi:hypothetical protein BAE46_00710 [Glaciecola punicea]|nr:hypothetical protein BAE46_00710 [Glaciecola punicea]